MVTIKDVPSHWISKATIARRLGISRVTADKQLTRIENDKELSGRLNVLIVDEGKRKLYFFDPSDVDAVFSELQKKSKRKASNTKRTNGRVNDSVYVLDNEIVKLALSKEELKVAYLEQQVAKLEDNLNDLRGENTFLKAQLTDQRPKSPTTVPKAAEEIVMPPKDEPEPSTIADIKKAISDVEKSNNGTEDDEPTAETKKAEDEVEARRARIDEHLNKPKVEPRYEKKTGFWNWLKGY